MSGYSLPWALQVAEGETSLASNPPGAKASVRKFRKGEKFKGVDTVEKDWKGAMTTYNHRLNVRKKRHYWQRTRKSVKRNKVHSIRPTVKMFCALPF